MNQDECDGDGAANDGTPLRESYLVTVVAAVVVAMMRVTTMLKESEEHDEILVVMKLLTLDVMP